jgi:acyl-CoA synthetase (AMP-forming)/AMP-acid ligase II
VQRSGEWNFAGRIVERLGRNSDLVDAATGQVIPVGDVSRLIVGSAAAFLSTGLQSGDRVLISCGVDAASAMAYLGAMYAGCVPVLVDERTLMDSGDAIFTKAQAKAAWTGKRVRWDWASKNGFPQMDRILEPRSTGSLRPAPRSEDDLAALMPTSGSTGAPRLVMVSHGNLIANTEAIIRSQCLGTDEKAMLIMPVSYCFGASIVHTHLYQGGGVVFDSRFMFPDKVLQAINTYGCTSFAGVPTVYNILLRRSHLGSIALPSLRRFLQAGGSLAPENVRAMRDTAPTAEFFVMYGQTEATARISCLPPERLSEKLGSAGVPLDNLRIRVVADDGQELANGQTGEIQVSGPSVCGGYLDDPEATQRKFDHGWLKTGDLGYRDDEGYIWLKGRTGEFMKIRGVRVSFAEVEARVTVRWHRSSS